MRTIHLFHLCPKVFQFREDMESDIWNQDVLFEKEKTYLIESVSGTGKSTLCSYLCGYRNDYLGELLFDTDNTKNFRMSDWTAIRSLHISHLIQDLRLFPELTVFENIELKNKITRHNTIQEIETMLRFLEIYDKRDIPVGKLSFGQQQRVAMIRALVQPFDFILADEPISHLDERNARLMAELMYEEVQKQKAGIIVTSIGKHMQLNYDNIYHL